MSDDETPTPAEAVVAGATEDAGAVPVVGDAPGTLVTADDAPGAADAGPPPERVTFRSRFLMPLLVPLAIVAGILFFVLNVSRVFLAVGGSVAVGYAAFITVVVLVGGSALSGSPKVRTSSLVLIIGGAGFVLLMSGLISIGAASPKAAAGPTQCAPITQKLTIVAGVGGQLRFTPMTPTLPKAGCTQINFKIANSTHTLQFDDASAANNFQQLNAQLTSWAGILTAGKHPFHCTISGHATAGMVGTLTVGS